ncbi:MAG: formate-dependent phosphoribosylglycinamide formyltransferase (GAR transformylase) [Mariniblastus sp.]|jgi:formate-dependent phosphoribosylglycinamide formyltransferase (GAR transformylase)
MKKIVFVAPYFMDATARFIDAAASVPGSRVGLVSCDPSTKLPPEIRKKLAAHYAVNDVSPAELMRGVKLIGDELGGIDRVIGMLEQIQVTLGEIRDQLQIPGMGATAANHFRDKAVMKSVLRDAGIPCAKHHRATSIESGHDFSKQIGFPLIVKPPDGAGAQGTFRCENPEQLDECLHAARPTDQNPTVIEEFIVGKEHSFDSICLNGKMIWSSISHYSPGPLEVVREPWIQWCVMIPRESDLPSYGPVKEIAQSALSALGMQTGLSHMEWFLRPDGSVAISEVGCRPPGAQFTSLISWAHDFDLYEAWAKVLIHEQFEIPARKYAAGAAYLRGMGQGRVAAVHGLQEIAESLGSLVVEAKIPQPGQTPTGSYEGEGHIIVRHPDSSVVENALKKIVSTIKVDLK